ncbi:DUF6527 family protein [uncultured Ramlibacter sp.]|uniref:DUF6527 family protein n=1 Tax=uncultured Ramlibacter sp. TaxID=260755 RepID=UPI00261E6A36|nr:DUF6527 family protein [uncultured Ramlibacter sp.]
MRIELRHVEFMPQQLEPGILYVSLEFGTAQHLCACGCGSTVRTPLGPAEWSLQETAAGPTLRPSIGNWQRPCHSHYWIHKGSIHWEGSWTEAQVVAGRARDQARLQRHLDQQQKQRGGNWQRLLRFLGLKD